MPTAKYYDFLLEKDLRELGRYIQENGHPSFETLEDFLRYILSEECPEAFGRFHLVWGEMFRYIATEKGKEFLKEKIGIK